MKRSLLILIIVALTVFCKTETQAQVNTVNGETGDVTVKLSKTGDVITITGANTTSVTLPFGKGKIDTLLSGTGISVSGTTGTVTVNALPDNSIWNANRLNHIAVGTGNPLANQVLKFDGSEWKAEEDVLSGSYNSVWNSADTNYYNSGSVQIGNAPGNALLTVDGKIHANELIVKVDDPVPDYVFEATYKLRSLKEVESYITENKHLPEIPSAAEIQRENIDIAKMNMLLLKKVEELTLYIIQNEKRIKELEN